MPSKPLVELLPREHVIVPLRAASVEESITALVKRLVEAGAVRSPEKLKQAMAEPRRRDIVSVGPLVAFPHYRTNAVEDLVVALGVAPAPLTSTSVRLDIDPRIIVLILAPIDASTLYLQTVAALARILRDDGVVERLAGAKSVDDVFAIDAVRSLRIEPSLTVRDIMIHDVESVAPTTPVRDAVDLMVQKRLRALPVVGEKLEVIGIITEHDVMRGLLARIPRATDDDREAGGGSTELLRVRDIMTRSVLCVSEGMGLAEAANLMNNKAMEQLPVTSEGKLTGFLTRGDIIRKLFAR